MTFVLKDFEELKKHFNDTIRIILEREGKEKIEDLSNPRKYELQFLSAVITELEARQNYTKQRTGRIYPTILYGAMLLITQDIEQNLNTLGKKDNSLLFARLTDGMGITDKNKPEPKQLAEIYKTLNNFLRLVYVDKDSRMGWDKQQALNVVPLKSLAHLIETSFLLEEAANKLTTSKLTVQGKTNADLVRFKVPKEAPSAVISQFGKWEDLKQSLHDLILKELANKNVAKISSLSKERSAQLSFLTALEKSLSEAKGHILPASERTTILAGAMHIVRAQIALEYKKPGLTTSDIPHSIIHTGLTEILKAKIESLDDIELLVTATNLYIQHMTIEHAEPVKGSEIDSIRVSHLFSDIEGFDLLNLFDLQQHLIKTCRVDALKLCVGIEVEATKSTEVNSNASVGFFGLGKLFSKRPTETKEDDLLDDLVSSQSGDSDLSKTNPNI